MILDTSLPSIHMYLLLIIIERLSWKLLKMLKHQCGDSPISSCLHRTEGLCVRASVGGSTECQLLVRASTECANFISHSARFMTNLPRYDASPSSTTGPNITHLPSNPDIMNDTEASSSPNIQPNDQVGSRTGEPIEPESNMVLQHLDGEDRDNTKSSKRRNDMQHVLKEAELQHDFLCVACVFDRIQKVLHMTTFIGACLTLAPGDSFRLFAYAFRPSAPPCETQSPQLSHGAPVTTSSTKICADIKDSMISLRRVTTCIFQFVVRPSFTNDSVPRDEHFKQLRQQVYDRQVPASLVSSPTNDKDDCDVESDPHTVPNTEQHPKLCTKVKRSMLALKEVLQMTTCVATCLTLHPDDTIRKNAHRFWSSFPVCAVIHMKDVCDDGAHPFASAKGCADVLTCLTDLERLTTAIFSLVVRPSFSNVGMPRDSRFHRLRREVQLRQEVPRPFFRPLVDYNYDGEALPSTLPGARRLLL